jgi:chromosome segregation ATPase
MNQPIIRRAATSAAIMFALALGVGAIRAAAAWTAASTELDQPVSTASVEDMLATERARSAALATQLHDLTARSSELESALAAAEGRIASDADVAESLAAQLTTARDRLAALEESIRKANSRLSSSAKSGGGSSGSTARSTSGGEHEEDHEEHEEEGHD